MSYGALLAVQLLKSDPRETIPPDFPGDAREYPACRVVSLEVDAVYLGYTAAVFVRCVSFAKAETSLLAPFANN